MGSAVPKKEQDMVKKAFPISLPKAKAGAKAKGKAKAEPKAKVEPNAKGKAKANPKATGKRSAAAEDSGGTPAKKVAKTSGSTAKVGSVPAGCGLNASIFESKKEKVSAWTNDKLKKLLKANAQSQTGNKAAIVAKCA